MLFNSLEFALFFPVVVALYWVSPARWRWLLLLIASYVFYMMWEPAYGLLLLLSTTVDWIVSRRLARTKAVSTRRLLLVISLTVNLGLLFSFKYYNTVNELFIAGASWFGFDWPMPESSLLLPVGISFYTFQTIGYTVDVFRGKQAPAKHFGQFALYVSFFPQLVAGPIERAGRLLPQLVRPTMPSFDQAVSGLRLAAWGMFKKVVVADRLAILVDAVYSDPTGFNGFALIVATVFFAWQVYCDFSGYSDIAIGVARVLGIDLMRNFDQPHLSRSMTEWWERWHISLSTWFRDYVYIPLGGNRTGALRWTFNISLVFVVSGIWHGASWWFAFWGALHAFLVVGDRFTRGTRDRTAAALGFDRVPRLRRGWQVSTTFTLWLFTLVPFRANSLSEAFWIYGNLGSGWTHFGNPVAFAGFLSRVNLDWSMFLVCLLLMPLVELVDYGWRDEQWRSRVRSLPTPVQWSLDYAVIFAVLLFGVWSDAPFVYFQF